MRTDGDDLDDRHIYVTQDGRFEYRRLAVPSPSALVIRFHAPLDSILRRLDAAYITSAWDSARSILEAHDVDPSRFTWGLAHTGQVQGIGHHHPPRPILETLGWLVEEAIDGEFAAIGPSSMDPRRVWRSVASQLEASDPSLCLAYDYYRAQRITRRGGEQIANDDGETALEIMRVDSTDSPVDWVLFNPTKRHSRRDAPSDDPSAPWMRLGQAMYERDHVAVVDAMDAVRSEYSEHGARICVESAMKWLMIRSNAPDD